MSQNFFDKDTYHGIGKRVLLYRYLQGKFGQALNSPLDYVGYNVTYFDAFAGCGRYTGHVSKEECYSKKGAVHKEYDVDSKEDEYFKDAEDSTENEKVSGNDGLKMTCPFGDESYGSPLVALEAMHKLFVERKRTKAEEKTALFVYEELKEEYYIMLKENVREYIRMKIEEHHGKIDRNGDMIRYYLNELTTDKWVWTIEKLSENVEVSLDVTISFYCCSFNEFNTSVIADNKPMLSFIDPCGYSHTPMEKVIELIGVRREIFLNFMVKYINRFYLQKKPKLQEDLNELFGGAGWKNNFPEEFRDLDVPLKMKVFKDTYLQHLTRMFGDIQSYANLKSYSMSIRKGSISGPDKGYLYYILFASTDLESISKAKYAMCACAQNNLGDESAFLKEKDIELYFSDYHYPNSADNPWIPLNAQENEDDYIYEYWKEKTCTFGELKEWILLVSPFQIHSNALKRLEKAGKLLVTSSDYQHGYKKKHDPRKRKAFPAAVRVNHDDPDNDMIKCKNAWTLQFI